METHPLRGFGPNGSERVQHLHLAPQGRRRDTRGVGEHDDEPAGQNDPLQDTGPRFTDGGAVRITNHERGVQDRKGGRRRSSLPAHRTARQEDVRLRGAAQLNNAVNRRSELECAVPKKHGRRPGTTPHGTTKCSRGRAGQNKKFDHAISRGKETQPHEKR